MIKIIEKYDGSYVIEDKDKEFFFNYHSHMNAMINGLVIKLFCAVFCNK